MKSHEDEFTGSDILILGAGMAGVAAANTLHSLGVKNILVVEGSNRLLAHHYNHLAFSFTIELVEGSRKYHSDQLMWKLERIGSNILI